MSNGKGIAIAGFFLGVALLISTLFAGRTVRDVWMSHQIIKVRGYAEKRVESNLAEWDVTVKGRGADLAAGYQSLAGGTQKAVQFLIMGGLKDGDLKVNPADVRELLKRTAEGKELNEIEGYELRQRIEVRTRDVAAVSGLATRIAALLGEGVDISVEAPHYRFTETNSIKSDLLVQATRDARERARTLAEGSGVALGPLRAARQGEFSVLAADDTSIGEESREDLGSISKKVTAVITVDYAIE